jgi:hypothetical protein
MRRRKLRQMVAVGLVVLAAGTFVLWPRTDRVSRENYDRIKEGMTLAEATTILGEPGDFTTGEIDEDTPMPFDWRADCFGTMRPITSGDLEGFALPERSARWVTDSTSVWLALDDSGRVIGGQFHRLKKTDAGTIDNLRWRAKRQWRRWIPEWFGCSAA